MNGETPAVAGPDGNAQVIAVLTAAARKTRVVGQGTPDEHSELVDFAEILCQIITSVAANVGGIETLLSGRPGSWESDLIRQIVQNTAGEDDVELLQYRTEPVRLVLDVESTFDDFGLYGLYTETTNELEQREVAAETALFEAVATVEEKTRFENIQAQSSGRLFTEEDPAKLERERALVKDAQSILDGVFQHARASSEPLVVALDRAAVQRQAVEQIWEQDQADYAAAYRETAQRILMKRGAIVTAELLVDTPEVSSSIGPPEWDSLTEELHEIARKNTPLPMTGQAPDWTDGTPAEAMRRSGLTFIKRLEQQSDG